jgi:elongation factor G
VGAVKSPADRSHFERAYHYEPGLPSPDRDAARGCARGGSTRGHMLEQLADHDDVLLEQLQWTRPRCGDDLRFPASPLRPGDNLIARCAVLGSRRAVGGCSRRFATGPAPALRLRVESPSLFAFKISHGSAIG